MYLGICAVSGRENMIWVFYDQLKCNILMWSFALAMPVGRTHQDPILWWLNIFISFPAYIYSLPGRIELSALICYENQLPYKVIRLFQHCPPSVNKSISLCHHVCYYSFLLNLSQSVVFYLDQTSIIFPLLKSWKNFSCSQNVLCCSCRDAVTQPDIKCSWVSESEIGIFQLKGVYNNHLAQIIVALWSWWFVPLGWGNFCLHAFISSVYISTTYYTFICVLPLPLSPPLPLLSFLSSYVCLKNILLFVLISFARSTLALLLAHFPLCLDEMQFSLINPFFHSFHSLCLFLISTLKWLFTKSGPIPSRVLSLCVQAPNTFYSPCINSKPAQHPKLFKLAKMRKQNMLIAAVYQLPVGLPTGFMFSIQMRYSKSFFLKDHGKTTNGRRNFSWPPATAAVPRESRKVISCSHSIKIVTVD